MASVSDSNCTNSSSNQETGSAKIKVSSLDAKKSANKKSKTVCKKHIDWQQPAQVDYSKMTGAEILQHALLNYSSDEDDYDTYELEFGGTEAINKHEF